MTKYIKKIDAVLANTEKKVSIDLQGKNLIVTGANGCGKTRFLNQIFERLKNAAHTVELTLSQMQVIQIEHFSKQLNTTQCNLEMIDLKLLIKEILDKRLVLRFFEATRQYTASNTSAETVHAMQKQAQSQGLTEDSSITFESYLVTYLNAGYMAFALRNDTSEKEKVDKWLAGITSDLRFLFEDDSLELEYKEKEKLFYIKQKGKDPFTFEQLSSGYSSILKVYTDLLMKCELRGIKAKELSGIVFIDEVDAHLHVSLQKKILAFLDNAYPNIQFIVSTHSSHVIQSVDNAVIYDLSKLEQLENLSMYSTEAITRGLLGVKSTSNSLDELVVELSDLTPDVEANRTRVEELIALLGKSENAMDARSKVALLLARQAILDLDLAGE